MKNIKEKWDNMSTEKQMKFVGDIIVVVIVVAYAIYVILTWKPGQLDGFWEKFPESFRRYNAYWNGKQIAKHFIR